MQMDVPCGISKSQSWLNLMNVHQGWFLITVNNAHLVAILGTHWLGTQLQSANEMVP